MLNSKTETMVVIQKTTQPINFKDILELANEADMELGEVIAHLEMDLVPMTNSVRKIGIATGYLYG